MITEDQKFTRAAVQLQNTHHESLADMGRAMLAAIEAHGCIEKPGLSVRQELVARLVCAAQQGGGEFHGIEFVVPVADEILALGDTK